MNTTDLPALPEPAITPAMVAAYLAANTEYWRRIDAEPGKLGVWRNGTPAEATEYSLRAALAAQQPAAAPYAWIYWHPSDTAYDGPNTHRKEAVSRFTDDTRAAMQAKGWIFEPLYAAAPAVQPTEKERTAILKGVGRINGDGWKDVTRIGEVVYVWNDERPTPYAPGQFPRIGNDCAWTASREQYDFTPATLAEVRECFDALLAQERERVLQGVKGQFEQMLAADRALRLEQPTEAVAPLGYISPKQVPLIADPGDESGFYIPMRKTAKGNFTLAIYAAAPSAPSAQPVAVPRVLPALPKPRVLASGSIAGKHIELHGWHTDDIEIWQRQHGLTFGAAAPSAPPQWKPIETAPTGRIHSPPLHAIVASVLDSGEFYVEEAWWDNERLEWWPANVDYGDANGSAVYPTHWMPLPDAPGGLTSGTAGGASA